MKVFYTFGSHPGFPFFGGWVEVESPGLKEAHAVFRAHYPDRTPGILNCSDYYTEAEFNRTDMPVTGNRGAFCHRRLTAGKTEEQSCREAMDRITLGECLHLYCVLGWTADIRARHLLALGRMSDDEDHETEPLFRTRKDPAGRTPPGGCTAQEARSGKSTIVLYRNVCEIARKKIR